MACGPRASPSPPTLHPHARPRVHRTLPAELSTGPASGRGLVLLPPDPGRLCGSGHCLNASFRSSICERLLYADAVPHTGAAPVSGRTPAPRRLLPSGTATQAGTPQVRGLVEGAHGQPTAGQRKGRRARLRLFSIFNSTIWGGPTQEGCLSKDFREGALWVPGAEQTPQTRLLPWLLRSFRSPGPGGIRGPGHGYWGLRWPQACTTRSAPHPAQCRPAPDSDQPTWLRLSSHRATCPCHTAPTLRVIEITGNGPAQSQPQRTHVRTHSDTRTHRTH